MISWQLIPKIIHQCLHQEDTLTKLATITEEAVPEHNVPETYGNTTVEKRGYTDAEAEAIHMILSEIRDNIHTTVDACTCDNREDFTRSAENVTQRVMAEYRCALCRCYLVQLLSSFEFLPFCLSCTACCPEMCVLLSDLARREIPQPLPIAPLPVPPLDDSCFIVRQAHTPATIDTESELEEAPSDTKKSFYETPSPSSSLTLPIQKRNQDTSELVEDTEDESLDSDTEGEDSDDEGPGSEDEGPGSKDEGPGSEEEEAAPEGQQQAVPVIDTTADKPLGLGYEALRSHELALGEGYMSSTFEIRQSSRSMSEQQRVEETLAPRPPVHTTWVEPMDDTVYTDILIYIPQVRVPVQEPPSPEWSSGSLLVSPSSPAVPTQVASPTTTPAATIAVDEGEFLEVGAQLELHRSILHDHTQRLEVLPPELFEGYDRDLRELYTRLRAVRDEIFSQHYRLRSLEQEQEQERAIIWRLVLALES
ncbi:hypothetical protein Tco_0017110 [Tanacetum coccineum]